jgi:hypothetical protein
MFIVQATGCFDLELMEWRQNHLTNWSIMSVEREKAFANSAIMNNHNNNFNETNL